MKFTIWEKIGLCKIFEKGGIINKGECNYDLLINNIEHLSNAINVSQTIINNFTIDYETEALLVCFHDLTNGEEYYVSLSINIISSKENNNYPRQIITFGNRLNQNFSQFDFAPSDLWFFYHCSRLLKKLLNERQCEEWIGDLEEALYKMYDQQKPEWLFHKEILSRTFDIFKSAFIMKVNSLFYKRKLKNR